MGARAAGAQTCSAMHTTASSCAAATSRSRSCVWMIPRRGPEHVAAAGVDAIFMCYFAKALVRRHLRPLPLRRLAAAGVALREDFFEAVSRAPTEIALGACRRVDAIDLRRKRPAARDVGGNERRRALAKDRRRIDAE